MGSQNTEINTGYKIYGSRPGPGASREPLFISGSRFSKSRKSQSRAMIMVVAEIEIMQLPVFLDITL